MPHKHIELFIPGSLKEEPIISDMVRKFNMDLRIIEASFSTESGWAYLSVGGEEDQMEKLFEYLRALGVNVEVRD